jgi:hypothetical protein
MTKIRIIDAEDMEREGGDEEPVAIICPTWWEGCHHPEICQEKCRDEDLKMWHVNRRGKEPDTKG